MNRFLENDRWIELEFKDLKPGKLFRQKWNDYEFFAIVRSNFGGFTIRSNKNHTKTQFHGFDSFHLTFQLYELKPNQISAGMIYYLKKSKNFSITRFAEILKITTTYNNVTYVSFVINNKATCLSLIEFLEHFQFYSLNQCQILGKTPF